MGNLGACHRPNLLGGNRHNRRRRSSECDELDLISLMVWINVDDRTDVTGLKSLLNQSLCENDPIMFFNHGRGVIFGEWFKCFL